MSLRDPERPLSSREPETLLQPRGPGPSTADPNDAAAPRSGARPPDFAEAEGPTLSSPATSSDPRLYTMAGLEQRVTELEKRLASTERELADVYGAVEHLVLGQEKVDRAMRQQRMSRYLVWGTLIMILGVFWMIMQSRMGGVLPPLTNP